MSRFRFLARAGRRLRKLLRPVAVAQEIAEELRLHIRMEAEDLMRQGVPAAEAERQARLAFGGVARFTEEARDAWPLRWLQRIGADVRYGLRSLRQTPAFTLTAIVAIAVSIGANATVFGAVDSMALRSLAVRDPSSLYAVYGNQGESTLLSFSYPTYEDLARAPAFSGVLAFVESPVTVSEPGRDDAAAVWAAHTSDNYFSELGVVPALGSFYRPGDLASPVLVISDALWASRYARDPRIIGRTLRLNGSAFTIIGVAPAQFTGTRLFAYDPAVWIPAGMHTQTIPKSAGLLSNRAGNGFLLVGRVQSHLSVAEAQASVDRVAQDLAARFPDQYRALTISLISNRTPINPWLAPPERIALIGRVALAGCLLVLLIACANVSSLMLARTTVRRQEMAARLALGASRGRLVQQLLTESLVLASLGAIAAIPIHLLAARGLSALTPTLEFASTFRPAASSRLLLWSSLLTAGAALVFGLGPALQGAGRGLGAVLRETAGRGGGGRRWAWVRESLVVGQALISALVLVAGGLLVRSLQRARALDTGFRLDSAVTFTVDPELSPLYDPARTQQFYRRLEADLAALPGVRASARAATIPLDGSGSVRRVLPEGDAADFASAPVAEYNLITPGFLAALGTPMLEGREFTRADTAAPEEPAIVNAVLAQRLWPHESALGKRLRLQSPTGPLLVVVGVARASLYRTLGERPRSALWRSLDRNPRSRTVVLVRAGGSTVGLAAAVHSTVRAIDPSLPVGGLGTLRQHVSVAYASVESAAAGALAFGGLGLLLAASGIYGIIAYAVSQRRREIGIRMALGAPGPTVLRLVAGRALVLTLAGALIGGLFVALVPMGLDSLLHGVGRDDLAALLSATALFSAVAVLAALSAALRAVRLNPMRVLRLD